MPDLISFNDAIEATNGEDRSLLIGNGFSADHFTYSTLLEKANLDPTGPIHALFNSLNTVDFEIVVRALEHAAIVERAFRNDAHAAELDDNAKEVREALVQAINAAHPKNRTDLEHQYTSAATFLENFSVVFTLNYDLLLYWVNLEKRKLTDGFGLGSSRGSFRGPFSEGAYCQLYNLHGGLHLFDSGTGDVMKAVDSGNGVIATITDTIVQKNRFPIYVAEGSSVQKMKKINTVSYLRYCYNALRNNAATIFIYGHSADENDEHVYQAIFASEAKHVFFGIHKPNDQKLRQKDGLLAKYQKSMGSKAAYTFFDSGSANVWHD